MMRVSGQAGARSPGVSANVFWSNSERATGKTIVEVFKQRSAANDGAARLSAWDSPEEREVARATDGWGEVGVAARANRSN